VNFVQRHDNRMLCFASESDLKAQVNWSREAGKKRCQICLRPFSRRRLPI